MKLGVSKVVAGVAGVALVTGVVWNGSRTIENAKTFVAGANTKLEAYQANETKLLAGIKSKNTQIDSLKAQIEELNADAEANATEIARLEGEVEALEAEKASLEEQLNNAGTNNESLLAEITRLEREINKANQEVAGLQTELDKVNLGTFEPTSSSEIDRLLAHGTDEEIPETIEIEFGNGWTHTDERMVITSGGIYKDSTITLDNKTDRPMTIKASANGHDDMTKIVDGKTKGTLDFTYRITTFEIIDENENVLVRATK